MKVDSLIKQQIEKALRANVLLNGADISVEVLDGHAVLLGTVDKYPKKELARKIAKGVQGVKSSDEEISVVINDNDKCSDSEIQSNITERFIRNFGNAHNDIKIMVREGIVWLEGNLKWKYQKDLGEECIIDIRGITDIKNNIHIPEKIHSAINEKDVFAAIYSNPSITTDIKIEIIGNRVVLKGKVLNVEQKNLVTSLVRNVTGVKEVENFLMINRISLKDTH